MSLFGSGQPILYQGTNPVAMLGNSIIERIEPDTNDIVHESKLNRRRDFLSRGTHLEIDIRVHLFKWNPAYISQNFAMFYALKGQKVSVRPYETSSFVYKQADGTDALFFVKEVYPYYLDSAQYRDAVRIELMSCDPIDFSVSSAAGNVKQAVYIAANYNVPVSDANDVIDNGPNEFQWRDLGGQRVLLTAQTLPEQNGIYVAGGNHNPLVRATDCDTWNEIVGASVPVLHELFIGSVFRSTAPIAGTLGTTANYWVRVV